MANSKFDKMINSLSRAEIATARKYEAAGVASFTQAVKALANEDTETLAKWDAIINPPVVAPAEVAVEEVEIEVADAPSFDRKAAADVLSEEAWWRFEQLEADAEAEMETRTVFVVDGRNVEPEVWLNHRLAAIVEDLQ